MKRIISYCLVATAAVSLLASCWKEPEFETGSDLKLRHQVTDLVATPGDMEVALSWSLPEGWTAEDFKITYVDSNSETVTLTTGNVSSYVVGDLVNEVTYTFNVQAIYAGDIVSGAVAASAKPTTSRFAVTDLLADSGDSYVTLLWTKPSTGVLGYTITFTPEGGTPQTVTVDKDAESYTFSDLQNDLNYSFDMVATYAKGDSDPASVKAMPALATPFFQSTETPALRQPVTFTFNREDFPTATDVVWTFPGDIAIEGDEASRGFTSTGEQTVTLSAKVNGIAKRWTASVTVREYVMFDDDFPAKSGAYNGFKGSYPVFSPDGKTVYNLTFSNFTNLMAYDIETGVKKWTYTVNQSSYNSASVNPVTGDIYFGTTTAGNFYAVTSEGELKWQFKEAGSMQSASPAVSKDGSTVFIIDASGNVFALDAANGSKLWNTALGAKGAGLLVNGNELVVAINSTSKSVNWLNAATGEVIKSYDQAYKVADICGGFSVSKDLKYAYYGHLSGRVSMIDLEKRTIVVDCKEIGTNNMWGPVTSPNGDVLFGCKDSAVYVVDGQTMELKYKYQYLDGTNNAFNYARPCVDTEGNYYVSTGSVQNMNFILGPDLTVKESWQYAGDGNKQMGGNNYLDGVLYSAFIGKNGENGIMVGKYVGGERYSAYGIDICGSCCIR